MPQIFAQNFGYVNWHRLFEANWKRFRAAMKEKDLDSLIVQDVANVKYLTGYSPMYSYFMLNTMVAVFPMEAERPTLFPIWYYVDFVRRRFTWLKDIRPIPVSLSDWPAEFDKLGLGDRVGIDAAMTHALGRVLEKTLTGKEFVDAENMLWRTRSVKNEEELKVMETATAIAEIGFKTAFEFPIEGRREFEVAAEIEYAMRKAGAEAATHCLAMSGENAALCQEVSTDKIIRRGETVIYDLGAQYEGYNAEFARTRFVGPPSEEQRAVYRLVYESEQKAIRAVRPGAKCSEVDRISRQVIREGGYEKFEFNYNLGHGIGTSVWEYPIIDQRSEAVFEPNMVVALEPAVYKPGLGGVRIEDLLLVTESGCKVLTRAEYPYL
jgi:Xaa-Pro aminopeptidase